MRTTKRLLTRAAPKQSHCAGAVKQSRQLAFCQFSYLDQVPDGSKPAVWAPIFMGANWPKAVRVEMAPLVPDAARLQPISLTAPIRIHRAPEVPYADY